METHTMPDEATRSRLRIRYAAVGAAVGNVVVFGLVLVAVLAATPEFSTALAVGVSAFMAMWAGTAFGVIFGNAAYEARFGHRTDAEDVAVDDADIHRLDAPALHDQAA